eukprot:192927_1
MDDEKEVLSNTFSGKLLKKGNINKSWKTRYFAVNKALQTVQYYEKETDLNGSKNEKGCIDLQTIMRIEVTEIIQGLPKHIASNDKLKSEKENTFHLVSSPRTFILAAPTKSDLMNWLRFIHSCIYPDILKEGHLTKQSGIQKTFKSRYFVLNKLQQLKYYDDERLTNCLGALDCKQITNVSTKTTGHIFNIYIDTRKWVIAAKNDVLRSEWVQWIESMQTEDWREQIRKLQKEGDKPMKINKRPMDDDSGYFERPTFDEKENVEEKPLKVNKRPKDDGSGFLERPTFEIKAFRIIDTYNRWEERQSPPFELTDPLELIVDLGKYSKLNKIAIEFGGDSYCTEISLYSSINDHKDHDWHQIGSLQLNTKPEESAEVEVKEDTNDRCLKVSFGGEIHGDPPLQISRIRFYGVEGTLIARNDITDTMSVIKTSYTNEDGTMDNILKHNDKEWMHKANDNMENEDVFIVFDTRGYILNAIDLYLLKDAAVGCKQISFDHANDFKAPFKRIETYDTALVTVFDKEENRERVVDTQKVRLDMKQNGVFVHDRLFKITFRDFTDDKVFKLKGIKFYGDLGENGELNDDIEMNEVIESNEEDEPNDAVDISQMMGGMMNMMQANVVHGDEDDKKSEEDSDEDVGVDISQMMGGMMNMSAMMGGIANSDPSKQENADDADDAIDCTHLVKPVESFPETDRNRLEESFTEERSSPYDNCWSEYVRNTTDEAWIIFDTHSLRIDAIEITFPCREPNDYHAKTIKVLTATSLAKDSEWTQIQMKTDIPLQEEFEDPNTVMETGGIVAYMKLMNSTVLSSHKLHLKSKHDRYIKLVFADRTGEQIGIQLLKWSGCERAIENDITNKGIKIYQCSSGTGNPGEAAMVLKANADVFEADRGLNPDEAWIIFDLLRFEVERIKIQFDTQCKPQMVKLKMSDVAPLYSFKESKSAMKWTLNTVHSFEESDWKDISLIEDLTLSGNEYKGGFKRFIQLEFSNFSAAEMKIVRIQFFGRLSERIAIDDEQFEAVITDAIADRNDGTDNAPYKPTIVDHTASRQGTPIENVFAPEQNFWMTQPNFGGAKPFLVLDTGNNAVEGILVKAASYIPYSTLRVFTSDKSTSSNWVLLFEDNEMQSKQIDGGTYDLTKYDIKKYIKLQFDGIAMPFFALERVRLYGKGAFLDKIEKKITIEDIKAMEWPDEDMIQKYQQTLAAEQQQTGASVTMNAQLANAEPLTDEWIKLKEASYSAWLVTWKSTELNAYRQKTLFERDEMLKLSERHKNTGKEFVKNMIDFDIKSETERQELNQKEEKAKELWENDSSDQQQLLKQKWQKICQQKEKSKQEYDEQFTALQMDHQSKVKYKAEDKNNVFIYQEWKDAVLNHPMELSLQYNAQEYETAVGAALQQQSDDAKECKECFSKLADLFDESLRQRKQCLHKFLLYQLSKMYYWARRKKVYNTSPVMIVFDVGNELDGKIQRLEFKMDDVKRCAMMRITVSTADELKEEKGDDDDIVRSWHHFTSVGEMIVNNDGDKVLDFEDTKVMVDYKNKRYLKVEFEFAWSEEDESLWFDRELKLMRMKAYVKDETNAIDDDTKENGDQLSKYKLKMIKTNCTDDKPDYMTIQRAYKINDKYYSTDSHLKTPFLIFDCEQRKVDQIEMRFYSYRRGQFDTICISTSNDMNTDDSWSTMFEEKGCFKSYCDDTKTIQLKRENQRYLKIAMVLTEESEEVRMEHLKFFTTDPSTYAWDIDQNVKNLASKMKIVTATKPYDSRVKSVLQNDRNSFRVCDVPIKTGDAIRNKIRDEVCRGVNLLRKSRGGAISKEDKHFIKFLLCFENDKCYDEMLYSAKLVMNILRKPLDIEYKRLQSIHSRILSLKAEEEHQCKGVQSNHKLLEWEYNTWYSPKKAMFWPHDLEPLTQKWSKLGLKLKDPEFKTIRRTGILSTDKVFISCEELAMKYLNAIAHVLDPSFQQAMKDTFRENRKKLNMSFPPKDNADLGVQSGPVKTEARQKIKILLKYFSREAPQCMAVLDIVRCGIVCEDAVELCSLFDLIVSKYSGSIMRVKNAFDDIKKGDDSHGYRAVMINIAFGDESVLPKGFRMVCEAQLLLSKYYEVRKNMHLGYGICRSEDGGIAHNKKPYVVLARDACKLGKLNI